MKRGNFLKILFVTGVLAFSYFGYRAKELNDYKSEIKSSSFGDKILSADTKNMNSNIKINLFLAFGFGITAGASLLTLTIKKRKGK
jgi:hypothetical protein